MNNSLISASQGHQRLPRKASLTNQQERERIEMLAAFMKFCGFFCYYFYDQMEEWPTDQIPTAATDGRRVYYNPAYFSTLKPLERAFALAHEVYHTIYKHPQRMLTYRRQGHLDNLPFDEDLFNRAADYVINADLIANKIGLCNPAWLYDPRIATGSELPEDIYKKLYKPGPNGANGGANGGAMGGGGGLGHQPSNRPGGAPGGAYGGSGRPDKEALSRDGRFDEIMVPPLNPETGKPDAPSAMEFKEAVARALDAAEKSSGRVPASIKRLVTEILEPQINWREHIRLLLTGKIGWRGESWSRPNRRRVALSAHSSALPVYMPGRSRYGAELVVCVVDNSGSIHDRELSAFFGEMSGILADCRPRRVMVIWCDAVIHLVEDASSLDELARIRIRGSKGGGGTSFKPPFRYLENHKIRPDALVYLTDMHGDGWPAEPAFPVIWAATSDVKAPWGETVRVKV